MNHAKSAAPDGASTFSRRLRTATAEAHRRTERSFGFTQIMDGTLSLDLYRVLLRRLHAIYAPIERAILALVEAATPSYPYRRKLEGLAADLGALGTAPSLREYDCPPGGLERSAAMLYVVEGATLGGKILAARIDALLGERGRLATRFFDSYGAACGSNWRRTQQVLDDLVYSGRLTEAAVVTEAIDVFTWFGACLDEEP